jgi:PAS domain S-box-containing protein
MADNRIVQLEDEVRVLKSELEHVHQSILPVRVLNMFFEYGREVIFAALNDEQFTVTEISDSISSFGYTPEEFISGTTGWKDIMHPDDLRLLLDHIRAEIMKGCKSIEHEHRIIAKSGVPVWVSCILIPERDKDGKLIYFFGKIKDITSSYDSLRTEIRIQNIQKSENIFRSIFDYSADGIALMDSSGMVREWSKGYEQISGLTKESVIGKMYLWEVSELLFPFEKQPNEELERVTELKELVATMQRKTLVRHVRHTKTGEHRTFNVL